MSYVGRFAPSPTGPLHLGSLSTAVASFLHARQHAGRWLLRIEDLDPQRSQPQAVDEIRRTLETMALHWDGEIVYQSERTQTYRDIADGLLARGLAFRCDCSRSALRELVVDPELGPRYPGTCRSRGLSRPDSAIRVRVDSPPCSFSDEIQGPTTLDVGHLVGDYVIYRRDGVAAYHLAVVVDDAAQGVTTVVRGSDLLRSTGVHLHLIGLLGYRPPRYAHVPILTHASGEKMSKQRGAARVDTRDPGALAARILTQLGCGLPQALRGAPAPELWEWAIAHWQTTSLRGQSAVAAEE